MRLSLPWITSAAVCLLAAFARAETIELPADKLEPDAAGTINAAIAAAHPGDKITLPAGLFLLPASIALHSGISLSGAGASETVLKFAGKRAGPMMTITDAEDVELTGLRLDGDNNAKATQGILATHCRRLHIHGLAITNLVKTADGDGPHAIYCSAAVCDSVFAENAFTNIGVKSKWGAGIRLAYKSNGNHVTGNQIAGTGRGGIFCNDGSTDNVITGNTVSESGGEGLGIEVQGCDRSLIEGNTIDHWLSVDNSSGSAIRHNRIEDRSGTYKFAGMELVDAHDVSFTHNAVAAGANIGISISGPKPKRRVYFAHNTIDSANTWAMQIQGDAGAGSVRDLYFYVNTFTKTLGPGGGALYPDCGHAVRINGHTHFITFDSNTITANAGRGLQISAEDVDDLAFFGNTITKNQQELDMGKQAHLLWSKNTMDGAAPAPSQEITRPPARITAPPEATIGKSAEFTVTWNRKIANALWDFGEGLPAVNATASHTFSRSGSCEVAVVVWDHDGQAAQAEVSVRIVPAESLEQSK